MVLGIFKGRGLAAAFCFTAELAIFGIFSAFSLTFGDSFCLKKLPFGNALLVGTLLPESLLVSFTDVGLLLDFSIALISFSFL
jgi:hypothetical protein